MAIRDGIPQYHNTKKRWIRIAKNPMKRDSVGSGTKRRRKTALARFDSIHGNENIAEK